MRRILQSKKKWILLLAAITLLPSCTEKESFFERGELALSEPEQRDYKGLDPLRGNDNESRYHFVQMDKTTYRSKIYTVRGSKTLTFRPRISGDTYVYFTIGQFKKTDDPGLTVTVTLGSDGNRKTIKEFSGQKRSLQFGRTLTLTGSSEISVEIKGNSQIFVSEPVYLKAGRRNPVFLIMADTLRADHLAVYGHQGKVSRNITVFSEDCVVFDRCFSTTTWTLPSHISLFTARNITNHGVYSKHLRLSGDIPVLTELLAEERYSMSFNEGTFVNYKYGFYRGFDRYTSRRWRAGNFSRRMFENTIRIMKMKGFNNLFNFLHTYQVHSPFRLHQGLPFSDSPEAAELTTGFSFPYKLAEHDRQFTYRPRSDRQRRGIITAYNSELEFFDHWFGYFISALKEMGMYENSMIIFMSDHGEEFFEHGAWGHGNNLYNETLRIPLLMKFPGNEHAGKRITQNCSILDVLPTVLDRLSIPVGFNIDGTSLLPLIRNPGKVKNDRDIESVLVHIGSREKLDQVPQMISVINGRYKLIYNFKYSDKMTGFYQEFPLPEYREYELYDLDTDFEENTDLSRKPELQKILNELKKKINRIKKDIFAGKVKGIPLKVTDKDMERLKALGYL